MFKIRLFILLPLAFVVAAPLIKAQSLEELLETISQNNLELKILEKEYQVALERAPQVSELQDPEVGVGAFLLPVETRVGAQSARLSATQRFPWFGTLKNRANFEDAKAKALYERIASRQLELFYEAKIPYYRLYEIQKNQTIIEHNITILEALERLALTKVESGKASATDVLRVQLQTEELKQELRILEQEKKIPIATLNQLIYKSKSDAESSITPVSIDISDDLSFATLPFDKEELFASIKNNHPMIRMFELQQEISRQALALNDLNGKPSFGVGMDYIMVNQRDEVVLNRNGRDIVQLRASVKIPLYRKKYEAKEREEKLKIETLDYQKEDVLSKFRSVIEKAYANHKSAQLRVSLYKKQKVITQSAINILQSGYSAQGRDFDELLRLEKDLIGYDLKILRAIVMSYISKAKIERYVIL